MKAVIHTGFSRTMRHEVRAAHDGKIKHMNGIYNDLIRSYSTHAPTKKSIGHGGLYKYKMHVQSGETILSSKPNSSQ